MSNTSWFDVDKDGLSNLMERRSKAFVVYELLQNAWDENSTRVEVQTEPVGNSPSVWIEVEDDDPDGFQDLRDAWTLFKESKKADDPERRGRFNLGEKLVLSLCFEAEIQTVQGTVYFSEEGGRSRGPSKRQTGSLFRGRVRMTRKELEEVLDEVRTVIPPDDVVTVINDESLNSRERLAEIEATLPSEYADEEGVLRRTERKTEIHVYEPRQGESPMLYEMGIPVVETDDRWHVDIQQTVPLDAERTNVTPAYLRKVRRVVIDEMADRLDEEDASESWVNNALEDPDVSSDAVETVMQKKFGSKRVSYDPSDPEANKRAAAQGYTVVHGATFSGDTWDNVREANALQPAGEVTPSASPLDGGPNAEPVRTYDEDEWTQGMRDVYQYTTKVGSELMQRMKGMLFEVKVEFILPKDPSFQACFPHGGRTIQFNVRALGKDWFARCSRQELNELVIHELAHHWVADHLSSDFYDKLTELGAVLTEIAMENPQMLAFRE